MILTPSCPNTPTHTTPTWDPLMWKRDHQVSSAYGRMWQIRRGRGLIWCGGYVIREPRIERVVSETKAVVRLKRHGERKWMLYGLRNRRVSNRCIALSINRDLIYNFEPTRGPYQLKHTLYSIRFTNSVEYVVFIMARHHTSPNSQKQGLPYALTVICTRYVVHLKWLRNAINDTLYRNKRPVASILPKVLQKHRRLRVYVLQRRSTGPPKRPYPS